MQPLEWLAASKRTTAALAEHWGFSRSSVSRMVRGERTLPSFEVMAAFFIESGGEVTIEDWLALALPLLSGDVAQRIGAHVHKKPQPRQKPKRRLTPYAGKEG